MRGFSPWGTPSVMTTKRQKPETYALTIVTHQRRSIFQRMENAQLMIHTLFRYRDQDRFALHAFVVMPDHIHVMITPAEDHATSRCVQLIKGGFSFSIREQFKGEVWNPGHHEHRVRDAADFEAQRQYIANNPSRKNHADYAFVHTKYVDRIDAMPPHLLNMTQTNESIPQGLKPISSQP
jgi:putative transposase